MDVLSPTSSSSAVSWRTAISEIVSASEAVDTASAAVAAPWCESSFCTAESSDCAAAAALASRSLTFILSVETSKLTV